MLKTKVLAAGRIVERQGQDRRLSTVFCRTVAESGRYADGTGLYLHVDPSSR